METETEESESSVELPIACSLSERDLAERRAALTADLFAAVEAVRELPDGYAYRFADRDGRAAQLLDFIAGERRCCSFFTFELAFEPNHGPLWLRLRGSAAIKDFVRETFGTSATLNGSVAERDE